MFKNMPCGLLKRTFSLESLSVLPSKRCRYDSSDISASNTVHSLIPKSSTFSECQHEKSSLDELERNVVLEIKGLHKRKQLWMKSSPEPRSTNNALQSNDDSEKTLFTFHQVLLICQKMLQEREQEIREKYDSFLQLKLAEQYDAFVKFTHDEIQQIYETTPSYYLS